MRRPHDSAARGYSDHGGPDLDRLLPEIGLVADYVARLKREIGALKSGELYLDRLPSARDELTSVTAATRAAADSIMAAAESLLLTDPAEAEEFRAHVERKSTEIMEACSFHDIAGQRLARAAETLSSVEKRLERFAKAVKIADATDRFDREAILRDARREVLLVEGPQSGDAAIAQDEVDKLFD